MRVRSACVSCVTAAAVFGLASLAAAQQLPNPLQTPGAKSRANLAQVCAAEFESSSAKPVAGWQREQALARYGRHADDFTGELDHLIPQSLGGTNDPDNLWPLAPNKEMGADQKKALEVKLRELVCNKTISLKAAQDAIRKDWGKAYQQYVKVAN